MSCRIRGNPWPQRSGASESRDMRSDRYTDTRFRWTPPSARQTGHLLVEAEWPGLEPQPDDDFDRVVWSWGWLQIEEFERGSAFPRPGFTDVRPKETWWKGMKRISGWFRRFGDNSGSLSGLSGVGLTLTYIAERSSRPLRAFTVVCLISMFCGRPLR